jgi:hypothetical protein
VSGRDEDDQPYWIEWENLEAVPPSGILQELFDGISDRGLRAEFTLVTGPHGVVHLQC